MHRLIRHMNSLALREYVKEKDKQSYNRQEDIKKIYKYVNSLALKEPFFLLGSKHGTGLFLSI
jgi:hypothetical protein